MIGSLDSMIQYDRRSIVLYIILLSSFNVYSSHSSCQAPASVHLPPFFSKFASSVLQRQGMFLIITVCTELAELVDLDECRDIRP